MSTFKILLIEDNPFFQGIWESIIGRATASPFKLDWANNDFIATEMLDKNKYDLIIADIILAGSRTGIDIWKEHACKDSFVIFVSSIPQEAFFELIKQTGKHHNHFISKPLNLNYCINCLAQVILNKQRNKAS